MEDFDLLRAVQADTGWIAVLGLPPDGGRPRQKLVATRDEADALIASYLAARLNVYYGVARYSSDESRTQNNVESVKAFWLDLDTGKQAPAGYDTPDTALAALKAFCAHLGLPRPVLVDSGRGLHAYWPLVEAIPPSVWTEIATRLRAVCVQHELYVDPAVFEVARVLRVPGTKNFKTDPPREVRVLMEGGATPVETFCQCLGMSSVPEANTFQHSAKPKPMSKLAQALQSNLQSNFSKIMRKSLEGDGCAHLAHAYVDRATLSEPEWFSALSVAKFCEDRDSAVHKLSKDHPEYSPDGVDKKIQHIAGPHTCAEFENHDPSLCEGCPHQGKIKSPIQLGKVLATAIEDSATPTEAGLTSEEDVASGVTPSRMPDPPAPYYRAKNGGVYITAEGEEEPMLVYEHDIWVVKRMRDDDIGDVSLIRVVFPHDGCREFVLNNSTMVDEREFKKLLAEQGVVASAGKYKLIINYLITVIKTLQYEQKADIMRSQFGWAANDRVFVVGDKEIAYDRILHNAPSRATATFMEKFGTAGSLELWKHVFSQFGRPGLELQCFGAAAAFGSPLMKFLGQAGIMIHFVQSGSGSGKTTALRLANSVWGNPTELLTSPGDTHNSRVIYMGVLNNIHYSVDELTNTPWKELSDLIYSMTQGKGKERAKASVNELRINRSKWSLIGLYSSNASFADKLMLGKANAEGENMRVLEFNLKQLNPPPISVHEGKELLDDILQHNYGHAGVIYAQYLVQHRDSIISQLKQMQQKLDRELKITQKERIWSAGLACVFCGMAIAKKLDLIDWDIGRIYKTIARELKLMRARVEEPIEQGAAAVIGTYINESMGNILVVDSAVDRRVKNQTVRAAVPQLEPRGELLIRYEPDTKMLYLASRPFRQMCARNQINYQELIAELEAQGAYVGAESKRLSKGMRIASPAVACMVINTSKGDFLEVDAVEGLKDVLKDTPDEAKGDEAE